MTSAHELGPLEMEVLGIVEKSGPQSVTFIQAELKRRGSELAYTTVMTVLSRLYEKGALTRVKDGKRFVYSSAKGSGAIKSGMLKRIKSALFQGRGTSPVTALLDAQDLSKADLQELRRWVNARLRERAE
ncbi:MAG TPA: BlaI/MecI/CopY family transcriptional regulator [Polyangiaceae bacterium]|nr:BlaI/MecI/CopY family transcriptional regulator [Polyangiaceae bacterium]